MDYKAKAEQSYRDGKYEEAIRLYHLSLKHEQSKYSPIVINSNLSACNFELGNKRIIFAWLLLGNVPLVINIFRCHYKR